MVFRWYYGWRIAKNKNALKKLLIAEGEIINISNGLRSYASSDESSLYDILAQIQDSYFTHPQALMPRLVESLHGIKSRERDSVSREVKSIEELVRKTLAMDKVKAQANMRELLQRLANFPVLLAPVSQTISVKKRVKEQKLKKLGAHLSEAVTLSFGVLFITLLLVAATLIVALFPILLPTSRPTPTNKRVETVAAPLPAPPSPYPSIAVIRQIDEGKVQTPFSSPVIGSQRHMIQFNLTTISWEAIAAVATFAAVVVALVPLGQDARRRKALAINLRIRLGSKFVSLRPSLGNIIQGGKGIPKSAVMTRDQFVETVHSIEQMLGESFVLTPDEQDQINKAFMNLELAARFYDTHNFTVDSAVRILAMIDTARLALEKGGILRRKSKKALEAEQKTQADSSGSKSRP
jgi:hypothetical protein